MNGSNGIRIKPHHFIDIVTAVGDGKLTFSPHPYGHAQHSVAAKIIDTPNISLIIELGADDICKPCIHNIDGTCDDTIDTSYRPQAPTSKQEWNLLIDQRWCKRLQLKQNDILSAQEFLRRLQHHSQNITDIYREIPEERTAERSRKLGKGIKLLLVLSFLFLTVPFSIL